MEKSIQPWDDLVPGRNPPSMAVAVHNWLRLLEY